MPMSCTKAKNYLFLILLAYCKIAYAEDISLGEDIIYRDAAVSSITEDAIIITHSSGVARVKYSKLPSHLQQKYFPNGTSTPTPTPKIQQTPHSLVADNKNTENSMGFYDVLYEYIYYIYENYIGIPRKNISFNDVALTLTILEGVLLITLLILLKVLLTKRSRRNETLKEREIRVENKKIKNENMSIIISKLSIAFSILMIAHYAFNYDTTVYVEGVSGKYYQGVQILPSIPGRRVHNLERANDQRNYILFWLAIGVFNGITILRRSGEK